MAEHTPTPWHLASTEHTELVMAFRNKIECVVAELFGEIDITEMENAADAAFIVKAVNSHDVLVEALEDILSMHDGNQPAALNMPDLDYARRTIMSIHSKARAALASVKETAR